MASGAVSLLCYSGFIESHWRYLYLLGSLTACFGCVVRYYVKNHPAKEILKYQTLNEQFKSFWAKRKMILLVALASGFGYSTYSIAIVLMNGFIPLITNITQVQASGLNTLLLIIDLAALPVFGLLASRFSRQKMMVAAAACAALSGIPLFLLLEGATLFTVIIIRICLVIIGVWFTATFHAWSQSLVPETHRYAVISIGYALGSQLLGSPTASISLWLFNKTQMVSSASWYWILLGLISSLWIAKVTANIPKQRKC